MDEDDYMFDESLELEAELEAELEREAAAIAADEELPPDMEEEARSVPAAAAPAAAPAGAPPPVDDEEDGCAAAMEGVEEQPAAAQQAMDEDEDEEAAVVEEEREVLRTFGATLEDGREGVLWVDKYAPHKFMELLSDERVNRQVLHWVKGWDEHVFGRAVKGSGARERAAASAARAIGMGASTRPDRPLLLISGPPGLGKTTLAHVVAKHAGYRPVEINASDERSAKVLKQRVSEATEMQSVYGDRRPPLIILDEIDGALGGSEGSGAIHELLKLANLSGGGGGDSSSPAKGSKTKGAHASKGLQRPVVCVCNDVHAPALRPLRAVAETIEFRAASNSQLLGRLRYVCREEKLAADPQLLAGLAQLSGNDVRTCLNTLQFVAAKSDTLTEAALASVGGKVVGKSPLALWKQVFVATPPKPASSGGGSSAASKAGGILGGKSAGASHPRTTRAGGKGADQAAALRTTSASVLYKDLELSDVGRVLDGVHENYLHVSYTDPQLLRTCEAAEALSHHDVCSQAKFAKGHFAMERYASSAVVSVHMACAVPHLREGVAWPRSDREARQKTQQKQALLRGWFAGLSPSMMHFYHSTCLVVDVLSPLVTLLTPPIKASSPTLMSTDERKVLASLIDVMIGFGLKYVQRQTDEGGYAFRMEPPLSELLPTAEQLREEASHDAGSASWSSTAGSAPPVNSGVVRELPAAVKQLLSTELNREIIRRHHGLEKPAAAKDVIGGASPSPMPTAARPLVLKPQPLAPKAQQPPVRERRDMFGRVITTAKGSKRGVSALGRSEDVHPIRFKFQEGVTDAVRRPVRVRDLL